MNRSLPLADEALLGEVGITLTPHSRGRVVELGFGVLDVVNCLTRPEQSYPGGAGHPGDRRLFQRRECCVVLELSNRTIVTVLLRQVDRWEHGLDRARCA